MSSAKQRTNPGRIVNSRRLLVCGLLACAAAIGIRIYHDRMRALPSQSADLPDLARRAAAQPSDYDAQLDYGAALRQAGRTDEATATFRSATALRPGEAKPYVWLGILAVQNRKYDEGIQAFEEALRRDSNDSDVYRSLGDLYTRTGKQAKSIEMYERSAQLRPADATAWKSLGFSYLRLKSLSRAREALNRALRLDHNDRKTLAALASTELQLGLMQNAYGHYKTLREALPNDSDALAGLAQSASEVDSSPANLKRLKEELDKSISLKPSPRCILIRGRIDMLLGDHRLAIDDFKRVLKTDPEIAEAYGWLSQSYAALGRPRDARTAAAQYERLNNRRRPQSSPVDPH